MSFTHVQINDTIQISDLSLLQQLTSAAKDIKLQDNEEIWIVSAVTKPIGICSDCCARSRHRHGWRSRSLSDLPIQGCAVKLKLSLSHWECRHHKCKRQTFTDQLPKIAPPYAHRTARMAEIVGLVGHSTGGRSNPMLKQLGAFSNTP